MNNKFLWVKTSDEIVPVPSLIDYILKATGLEAEITEVKEVICNNNTIAMAKDMGCGIILPATRMDLLYSFTKAAIENDVELLFPEFNDCREDESEIIVEAPCGIHYLRFECFKRITINDDGIYFLDI